MNATASDPPHPNPAIPSSNNDGLLSLLTTFSRNQSTRTSLSHELVSAFSELGITDEALTKVVQVASMGLLEVRAENEAVIDTLASLSNTTVAEAATAVVAGSFEGERQTAREMLSVCREVERLEKERLREQTQSLQVMRMLNIQRRGKSDGTSTGSGNGDIETAESHTNTDTEREMEDAVKRAEDRSVDFLSLRSCLPAHYCF